MSLNKICRKFVKTRKFQVDLTTFQENYIKLSLLPLMGILNFIRGNRVPKNGGVEAVIKGLKYFTT